jgi:hypothetical protein
LPVLASDEMAGSLGIVWCGHRLGGTRKVKARADWFWLHGVVV